MQQAVIAIVGRPNVGKSTLFNQLTKSRNALVADFEGLTRDRHYGAGKVGDIPFTVIDTGGLTIKETPIEEHMMSQAWMAIAEADIIFFVVDGRSGLLGVDREIAKKLRSLDNKKIYLVVNKTDGIQEEVALSDFYGVGFGVPIPIAASHGRGILHLVEEALKAYTLSIPVETTSEAGTAEELSLTPGTIKIAIVGRPNVGKSTLVNRLLGEERVIVFDEAGTTRDSIYIPLERFGKSYTIIDTAGVRRKARVNEMVEKFSVIKTLQAIQEAEVAILIMDARAGVTDQDIHLLGFILETGTALVIAINKWDGLENEFKEEIRATLNYRLHFADFAPLHYISALHGSGVGNLFESVDIVYLSATKPLPTSELNEILYKIIEKHPPPLVNNRRIKLRYAHSGGHNPPIIVIHGNQTDQVPESYKRYLMNAFREALHLKGTPIRIEFKNSTNPYAGKRNTLTPRQMRTRDKKIKENRHNK